MEAGLRERDIDRDGSFELSQSHLVDKIINHVRITVSASLNCREMPARKPLLHKYESSLGRYFLCNYRATVGMFSCLQVLIEYRLV